MFNTDMKPPNNYTAEDIKVLAGLDPVRLRPGMFVGGIGSLAWHHMVFQILEGIFEEAQKGNGNAVSVNVNNSSCLIAAPMSFSGMSHRYHNRNCTREDLYIESNALHQNSWTSVVRALSSKFSIRVVDEEGKKELSFFNNTDEDEGRWRIYEDKNHPLFEVEFTPDFNILGAPTQSVWNKALIKQQLRVICGIKEGFRAKIRFGKAKPESIHMPNGLADLLVHHVPEVINPVRFQGMQGRLAYEVAMARNSEHEVISFANTVQTRKGGDHVRAVEECCDYAGLDAKDFAMIISVFLPHPKYEQPVKDELISTDIKSFIVRDLTDKMKTFEFQID